MHRIVLVMSLCWTLLFASGTARAGVLFFVNDPVGFATATTSLDFLGLENWSSAGNANSASVLDPVRPGIANGVFPNGTNVATGITVQSNSLGSAATVPAPGSNMFFAPAGFVGVSGAAQQSNQLSANTNGNSFDVLFADVGASVPAAVSLSPMFYRTNGPIDSGTIAVQVYDDSNGLLGTTSVANVADVSEASFLGIVATGGDVLGRVNLWAGMIAVPGADNIRVHAVPEPGTLGALAALTTLITLRGPARARRIGNRSMNATPRFALSCVTSILVSAPRSRRMRSSASRVPARHRQSPSPA